MIFFQYLLFQKKGKEGIQEEWVHCQDCSGQLQSMGDSPGNCRNFQTGVQVDLIWSCQLTGWTIMCIIEKDFDAEWGKC